MPATASHRSPLQRFIIRLAGGRRLTITRRTRPRLSCALLMLLGVALAKPALALDPSSLPNGGQVVAGQAGIQQSGNQLTVNQTSDKAILNWQSFNIGSAASVEFKQPGASSVALNRVIGNDASQIHGKLQANGQVFISNPNGVLFGAGSQVDVGGLVATTLNLGDESFMQGRYTLAGNSQAEIANAGQIRADGAIALVAATVRNEGSIQARDAALAAGSQVTLDMNGDGLLSFKVDANALRGEIANGGAIQAGTQVIMAAATADALAGSVVNNSGIVRATGLSTEGGRISLSGGLVSHTGSLDASAASGGQIQIAAHTLMDAGQTLAEGSAGQGGQVRVTAQQVTQTSSARISTDGTTAGGSIRLQGGSGEYGKVYSSATLSAQGTGTDAKGGSIALTADSTQLRAASLDASGQAGGGSIEVGGGWQGGNAALANARETGVNASSTLKADATLNGDGGSVVVWSDAKTTFAGHISATGGSQSGNGGKLEVSGKEDLVFAGTVNTASPFGLGGSLLLDPKNIIISDAGALFDVLNLDDPNPGAGNSFGLYAEALSGGNVAVTANGSDIGGITDTGAVYLFDGQSGALISSLYGSQAGDRIGNAGITLLSNGNYVIRSANWNSSRGAATWGSGTTGVSGPVSLNNSLIGVNANDLVSTSGITALSNGNYVVNSQYWDGLKGAVTWGNGATGTSGTVSVANSLVGSIDGDQVGYDGITALNNGNYVVRSSYWNSFTGAVTWGDGSAGVTGAVSDGNSLLGAFQGDRAGGQISVLSNGNYLIHTSHATRGAVTFASGSAATFGIISASNSLVGASGDDRVGSGGITELSNGNYVVSSYEWGGNKGAATWGDGSTGTSGVISASNSLIGSAANDQVGLGITALNNGNYVVSSPAWDGNKGAATWGNGNGGTIGEVNPTNSLVGSANGDQIGLIATPSYQGSYDSFGYTLSPGVLALANGNYVVSSPFWNDNRGAATWADGAASTAGIVSIGNSLVGTNAGDRVGYGGLTALTNGNYVVSSYEWDGNKGAVTWADGNTGLSGTVSADNSLVGTITGDRVGYGSAIALSNGNYVARSIFWGDSKGAVTWGNGISGIVGTISASNSLVGSSTGDRVGVGGVIALNGGNYVINTPRWSDYRGAITWGNGVTGTSGEVSASNSLVGSTANDRLGIYGITVLSNGNYVIRAPEWNGYRGAVAWGNGTSGTSGVISAENSLIGSAPNDAVGSASIIALSNGNYVVRSGLWSDQRGAVTWGDGTTGSVGVLGASNSLVGVNPNDQVGHGGVFELSDGRIGARSPTQPVNGLQTGRVSLLDYLPSSLGGITYGENPANDLTINPQRLATILNNGTSITLQANNDILFNSALTLNNPGGNGGDLTLLAGRNITFNASLNTDSGNLTAVAGDPGAVAAQREPGTPTITLANGVILNVGTGTATLAAIGGDFINNAGSNAIQTSGAGRYLVYSSTPTATLEGLSGYNKHYNQHFTLGSAPTYADSGSWFLYSIAPVLTVTPDASSQTYGDLNLAGLGYGLSGFIDSDDEAGAGVSGTASFTSNASASSDVGNYNLAYASGLASSLGYTFVDAVASLGELNITQRLITLAASATSKIYGELDPILAATLSAGSLGNGDSLADVTGTLSREAGENVGSYDITLGSGLKAGNYSITFDANNNAVSITPRDLLVQAQNASRLEGEANPTFSANISGWAFNDGLVDLQGNLGFSTPATQASTAGDYAISTFGLTSTNYQILFSNGTLSVLASQQPAPTLPAGEQSSSVATQLGAQTSTLLGGSNQVAGGAGSTTGATPLPTNLAQWLNWITQQVMAWNAPATHTATVPARTPSSLVSAATLLAGTEDEQLGGLITRNAGVRLP